MAAAGFEPDFFFITRKVKSFVAHILAVDRRKASTVIESVYEMEVLL